MNATDFKALFDLVAAKTAGWQDELYTAWPCLTQDQKALIAAVA